MNAGTALHPQASTWRTAPFYDQLAKLDTGVVSLLILQMRRGRLRGTPSKQRNRGFLLWGLGSPKLALNRKSSCLSLLCTGIAGVCYLPQSSWIPGGSGGALGGDGPDGAPCPFCSVLP